MLFVIRLCLPPSLKMRSKRASDVLAARQVLNGSFRFFTEGLVKLFTDTVFNFVEEREMLMGIRPRSPIRYIRRVRRPRMRSAPPLVTRARQRRTPKSDARQTHAIKKRRRGPHQQLAHDLQLSDTDDSHTEQTHTTPRRRRVPIRVKKRTRKPRTRKPSKCQGLQEQVPPPPPISLAYSGEVGTDILPPPPPPPLSMPILV